MPALSEEHYAAIADNEAAASAAIEANFRAAEAAAAAGPASSGDYEEEYEAGVYSPYSFDFQSEEDGSTRSDINPVVKFLNMLKKFRNVTSTFILILILLFTRNIK